MKHNVHGSILGLSLLMTVGPQLAACFAQGTAFTFQGRLNYNGNLANGNYDMRFAIHDSADGPQTVGTPLTNTAIAVSSGLFTVTLDFGPDVFTGPPRWLEIGVRTNGAVSFDALSPRQQISPTPYAITAGQVLGGGLAAGTYANAVSFDNAGNRFSGSFAGDGAGLSNLNAATLGGWDAGQFWRVNGNSGVSSSWYLGTADRQPFEMRVDGYRGLRLEPTSNRWANLLVGSTNNLLDSDVSAATIAGGVGNAIGRTSGSSTVAGGRGNAIGSDSAGSYVGGGIGNRMEAGSVRSVIAGGWSNWVGGATGPEARVAARAITDGTSNTILAGEVQPGNAFIGGGWGEPRRDELPARGHRGRARERHRGRNLQHDPVRRIATGRLVHRRRPRQLHRPEFPGELHCRRGRQFRVWRRLRAVHRRRREQSDLRRRNG